ncbi:MAG: hypothetical protein ABF449_00990 [Ethanoligenens sp.]
MNMQIFYTTTATPIQKAGIKSGTQRARQEYMHPTLWQDGFGNHVAKMPHGKFRAASKRFFLFNSINQKNP